MKDGPVAASPWYGRRGGRSVAWPSPDYSRSNRADCSVTDIFIELLVEKILDTVSLIARRVRRYYRARGDAHPCPASLSPPATFGEGVWPTARPPRPPWVSPASQSIP